MWKVKQDAGGDARDTVNKNTVVITEHEVENFKLKLKECGVDPNWAFWSQE